MKGTVIFAELITLISIAQIVCGQGGSTVSGVQPISVLISPEHAQITESATNVTVNCSSESLGYRSCQFTWLDYCDRLQDGPILDLTDFLRGERWNESRVNKSLLTQHFTGYQYVGNYYSPGSTCGVTLNLGPGRKLWVVGCRLRSWQGSWYYGHMTIHAHANNNIATPPSEILTEVVVLPGNDTSLLIKANASMKRCDFSPPAVSHCLQCNHDKQSANCTAPKVYRGSRQAGDSCGITLRNVTDDQNGWFLSRVGHQSKTGNNIETRLIPVVVAHPPNAPVLEITTDILSLGSILEATCTVDGGRPVANITWYIGDRLIRQDSVDESQDPKWRWPTTRQKVTQQLARRLKAEDHAQYLRCVASHIALAQPLEAKRLLLVQNVSPQRLTVTPEHLHIGRYATNVTIICQASVPLTTCQFKWRLTWPRDQEGPLFDLSQGPKSELNSSYIDPDLPGYGWHYLKGYSYSGTGLQDGQCGITLQLGDGGTKDWVVGCRGQAQNGWLYGYMTLFADGKNGLNTTVSPREAVVLPGRNISLLVQAGEPLITCSFKLPNPSEQPNNKTILDFGNGHQSARGDVYRYFGASLPAGECGVVFSEVREEMNGWVHTKAQSRLGDWETIVIPFVVAHRPDDPILRVLSTNFSEGAILEATCAVSNSRPLANISWYLGSQVLRQDHVDDSLEELPWRWPIDLQNITQRLVHTLEAGDNGQALRCVVHHMTLGEPLEAKRVISFEGCGRRNTNSGVILVAGGEDGKPGEFLWHIGVFQLDDSNGGVAQICGGTLITTSVVLSAAHCFWDYQLGKKNNATQYKVAAGKQLRVWDDRDPNVQKRDVLAIVLPRRYSGRATHFASDIALLRIATPFKVTASVGVICMDWDGVLEGQQLTIGNKGIVAGWGYTESDQQSDALKYVELPYVQTETCYKALPFDLQRLLTHDKFCAGFINRSTSVCGGDSGGGLVFLDDVTSTYYLRGVVSIAFTPPDVNAVCYSQQYTGFTAVSQFTKWIRKNI